MLSQTLDLSQYPAEERFGRWHDMVAEAAAPQRVSSAHSAAFTAWARLIGLGGVTLTSFAYPALDARRAEPEIRRGDPETYTLALPLTGTSAIVQGRQESLLRPGGDFTLVDSSRPHEAKHAPDGPERLARSVTVIVPRALVPMPHDTVLRLAAARLDSRAGMGALLAQDMLHIAQHPEQFHDADAAFLGHRIADLVAAMIGQYLDTTRELPADVRRRALRSSVDAFIDERLGDPDLGPQMIAAAHHISVSTLYRLFADGRSVREEIKARRLERCHRDLLDPRQVTTPIAAIARRHGLPRQEVFSRQFRAAFGDSPRDVRRTAGTAREKSQKRSI
ncbi:helix-turn-helix domain-containing protein [Dactylosporangium sp. CA-092794]|uniref:AraC-like ligand-binding domain-containing protein n=1 Tax=Dactylosporangium sp. CA-092794 TaxID=3239929 RepID=UPI003D8B1F5A